MANLKLSFFSLSASSAFFDAERGTASNVQTSHIPRRFFNSAKRHSAGESHRMVVLLVI
jgi:hypothetical protein